MALSLTMNSMSFFEPMRKNWYIVQFSGLEGSDGNDEEALSIACKTCGTPHLTTTPNEVHRINDIVYTPGKSSYDTIQLSFYEYIQDKLTSGGSGYDKKSAGQILYEWQTRVHNAQTGVQGAKKNIAHNAAIVQFDGNGSPVRVWNLYNVWVTDVQFDDFDAAEGGLQMVTATLRYDWAEQSNESIDVATGA